jgi:hypothetical protein
LGLSVFRESHSPDYIIALSILACTQYAGNSGIVAVGAALKTDQPFWRTWKEGFLWTSITYFVGAFSAGIVSKLIGAFGFYAFLAIPIIVVLYFTYTTYLKKIEASKSQAEQAEHHVDALRESEERFRSAFDHAAGMALVAPEGRWIQVSPLEFNFRRGRDGLDCTNRPMGSESGVPTGSRVAKALSSGISFAREC